MIKEIKTKLDNNIKCDLNVEELKLLYSIDNDIDEELFFYIENRNNYYVDFCKIFGKEHVARNQSEITEDTIIYIGDLFIEEKLSTYNLRYICGDLFYRLDEVYNLENLKGIIGDADFEFSSSVEGLENLQYILGYAKFSLIKNATGLDNLKYIGRTADFSSLISAQGLNNLQYIGGSAFFDSLINDEGIIDFRKILRY